MVGRGVKSGFMVILSLFRVASITASRIYLIEMRDIPRIFQLRQTLLHKLLIPTALSGDRAQPDSVPQAPQAVRDQRD